MTESDTQNSFTRRPRRFTEVLNSYPPEFAEYTVSPTSSPIHGNNIDNNNSSPPNENSTGLQLQSEQSGVAASGAGNFGSFVSSASASSRSDETTRATRETLLPSTTQAFYAELDSSVAGDQLFNQLMSTFAATMDAGNATAITPSSDSVSATTAIMMSPNTSTRTNNNNGNITNNENNNVNSSSSDFISPSKSRLDSANQQTRSILQQTSQKANETQNAINRSVPGRESIDFPKKLTQIFYSSVWSEIELLDAEAAAEAKRRWERKAAKKQQRQKEKLEKQQQEQKEKAKNLLKEKEEQDEEGKKQSMRSLSTASNQQQQTSRSASSIQQQQKLRSASSNNNNSIRATNSSTSLAETDDDDWAAAVAASEQFLNSSQAKLAKNQQEQDESEDDDDDEENEEISKLFWSPSEHFEKNEIRHLFLDFGRVYATEQQQSLFDSDGDEVDDNDDGNGSESENATNNVMAEAMLSSPRNNNNKTDNKTENEDTLTSASVTSATNMSAAAVALASAVRQHKQEQKSKRREQKQQQVQDVLSVLEKSWKEVTISRKSLNELCLLSGIEISSVSTTSTSTTLMKKTSSPDLDRTNNSNNSNSSNKNVAEQIKKDSSDSTNRPSAQLLLSSGSDGNSFTFFQILRWLCENPELTSKDQFAKLKVKLRANGCRALTTKTIRGFEQIFDVIDVDGSGQLDKEEIGELFTMLHRGELLKMDDDNNNKENENLMDQQQENNNKEGNEEQDVSNENAITLKRKTNEKSINSINNNGNDDNDEDDGGVGLLSKEDLDLLFSHIDADGSGSIDFAEVLLILASDLDATFQKEDEQEEQNNFNLSSPSTPSRDRRGSVFSNNSFSSASSMLPGEGENSPTKTTERVGMKDSGLDHKILLAFRKYDPHRTGYVTIKQLRHVVAELAGSHITEEQLTQICEAAHTRGDGYIDYLRWSQLYECARGGLGL